MMSIRQKIFLLSGVLTVFLFVSCAKRYPVPLELLKTVDEESYEDANAVVIFDSTKIDVDNTGKGVFESHKLVKILTNFGKQKYGEATFSYCSIYDTVIVKLARTITPDGKSIPVPKENIVDVPLPTFEGSKFFVPNVRIIKVTFPNLEEGSSVEYIFEDILHNPPMDSHFDYYDLFEGFEPIVNKTLIVTAPKDMGIRHLAKNGEIEFDKTMVDDKIVYRWSVNNVERIIPEPMMPFFADVVRKVLISSVPTWETWSRWYYELSKPTFEIDDAIVTKIDELIANKKTEDEKIRALYYFVSQNIRYVETELTGRKGGYQPAPAPVTFKNKYGVCRDKAALLVAMLKYIGVDAYIVLTNPIMHVEEELPVAEQFNHAIVAVKRDDGTYYYMDPTAEESREYLVPYEMGKGVLVCDEDGKTLDYTPIIPPQKNMILIETVSELEKDGTLTGKMILTPEGSFDFFFRKGFKHIPPKQMEQTFQMMVQSISPGAELIDFSISDITDLYTPMKIEISYRVPDYGLKVGKELHFKFPAKSEQSVNVSMGGMGGNPWAQPERKYPLYMWVTMGIKSTETVTITKGYRVKTLPEDFKQSYDRFSYSMTYSKKKNQVTRKTEFFINHPLIPVDEYQNMRKMMEKVEQISKQEIVLVRR